MRKFFIAGNWKLNKTPSEATALARELRSKVSSLHNVDIAIAPTAVGLVPVAKAIDNSNIHLAAQNVFWEDQGAFTGEISAPMLKDAGCTWVIIGHSERRQYFGETDETVAKRIRSALDGDLKVIFCIGETLEQRESGSTFDVLKRQILGGLTQIKDDEVPRLVVAYEPVWAIGTGRTATPEQAQDAHAYLRKLLAQRFSNEAAQTIRIQYGGSVKPGNAKELLSQPDIDGALVGGASLSADSFAQIIKAAISS